MTLFHDPKSVNTFATLRMWGKDVVPRLISQSLGLEPTDSHEAGSQRSALTTWGDSYWEFSTQGFLDSDDISHHITYLLDKIAQKTPEIECIIGSGGNIDIFCFLSINTFNYGFTLSPLLLQRVSSMGLSIGIDIYTPCSEE